MFGKSYYLWKSACDRIVENVYEDILFILNLLKVNVNGFDIFSNAAFLFELGMLDDLEREVNENKEKIKDISKKGKFIVIDPYELRAVSEFYDQNLFIPLINLVYERKKYFPEFSVSERLLYFPSLPERELGLDKVTRKLLISLNFQCFQSDNMLSGAEPFIKEVSRDLAVSIARSLVLEARKRNVDSIAVNSQIIYKRLKGLIGKAFNVKLIPLMLLHYM